MARSGNQIGIQQAHLPEVCYPAQGFKIIDKVDDGELTTAYGPISVRRLKTNMRSRYEPVTYWLTMGDQVGQDPVGQTVRRNWRLHHG